VVVVLTLALGIGANSAIYSAMRAALAPLGIPHVDRVVMVSTEDPQRNWRQFPVSVPDYRDWQSSGVFAALAAFDQDDRNLRLNDRAERVDSLRVTREFFEGIGIHTRLGRDFNASDFQPGAPPVTILSDGLWRSKFGAAEDVVNRAVIIDGAQHTIIGVLPRHFPKVGKDPLFTPVAFTAAQISDRGSRHFTVVGRLRDGVSIEGARARLTDVSVRLEHQEPGTNTGVRAEIEPFEDVYQQDARELTTVLIGAVGFVLLIACANIASLVLARGSARAREMTIRAALGAGGWRLARQLLTENLMLAVLGGIAAILPAWGGIRLIASFQLEQLPNAEDIALDWRALAFNLVLALATGLLVGLAPAWQASRLRVADALKAAGRTVIGGPRQRLRSLLVVAEVALTLVLLVGAGLMIRTFFRLRAAHPAYQASNVMTMKIALSEHQYPNPQKQAAFVGEVLNRVRTLPDVKNAAVIDDLPGTDSIHGTGLHFPDRPEPRPGEVPVVFLNTVSGSYFETMQIPLLRGRYLTDSDAEGKPLVAVIDDWTPGGIGPTRTPWGASSRQESRHLKCR
jgi:putative ABC transport system permease protein